MDNDYLIIIPFGITTTTVLTSVLFTRLNVGSEVLLEMFSKVTLLCEPFISVVSCERSHILVHA